MPTAAAAFSIGTAKPMPMNTRWSVGIEDAGDDADDFAVGGDERPAGIAGIGRRVELDQVGQQALAFAASGTRAAGPRRRPPMTDGPMPNGKPTATTSSPDREVARSSAASPASRSSGIVFACSTARSCSGCDADDVGVGLGAVGEHDADPLRRRHDVQVGEDDALVDDDDAGADAALACPSPSPSARSSPRTRTTEGRIVS